MNIIYITVLNAKISALSLISNKGAGLGAKDSHIHVNEEALTSSIDSILLAFMDFAYSFIKKT